MKDFTKIELADGLDIEKFISDLPKIGNFYSTGRNVQKILRRKKTSSITISALIIDSNYRILLLKERKENRNDFKYVIKQPGGHFFPNRRDKGKTFFEVLIEKIEDETGLKHEVDYELVSHLRDPISIKKDTPISSIINSNELKPFLSVSDLHIYGEFSNNGIVPQPFMITHEKGNQYLSGQRLDLYYSFILNESGVKKIKENKHLVMSTINDSKRLAERLKNNTDVIFYSDILFVYDRFIEMNTTPRRIIRFCTFDLEKAEIQKLGFWRITNKCNCSCEYCFIDNLNLCEETFIDKKYIKKAIENCNRHNIKKIVITGGEPLIISNFEDVVILLEKEYAGEYSICTNAQVKHKQMMKIFHCVDEDGNKIQVKKLKKITISLDSNEQNLYSKLKPKHSDVSRVENVVRLIKECRNSNINFSINLVANKEFVKNPKNYLDFLQNNGVRHFSLSLPILSEENNDFFITDKDILIECYNRILNDPDINTNYFKTFELILSNCNNGCDKIDKINYIDQEGELYNQCCERR